ncbi:hypothetical protein SEA_REYNAULD_67 [Rhodococcus phage Reynauld]|uniref:Uncharacterized protein n=1 Tax=Rhodococcus phage Reynauld TaxID=3062845 RepID=A0ACD4UHM4_9CAUD|nr:hypothetical protein SEA_REYNAULD_67 [Rhodococcus phage Reynauld]
MRELGQYTRNWCPDCDTGIVYVQHHGVTTAFERVDHAEPLYVLGPDHTMSWCSAPAITYRPHRCPEDIAEQRLEHQLKISTQHGKFVPKLTAEVTKAYDVPCPECNAVAGEKCWNRTATKNPQHNRIPHKKRLFRGLVAQGLAARPLDVRGWGSNGYVLESVDVKLRPWRKGGR